MKYLNLSMICLISVGILTGCSGPKLPTELEKKMSIYEDAVRIKPEVSEKYFQKSS